MHYVKFGCGPEQAQREASSPASPPVYLLAASVETLSLAFRDGTLQETRVGRKKKGLQDTCSTSEILVTIEGNSEESNRWTSTLVHVR